MLELIKKLMQLNNDSSDLNGQLIKEEIIFISNTLEMMRDAKEISNDAYLEYGSIQGGLSVISSLLEQGITDLEIDSLLNTLLERTKVLDEKYPYLNGILVSYRII